ncbi:MAG TPA: hypothetical protein VMM76_10165 [Pirellulaceae bacterium]|nr:hypothetical protein [Pirellulaceae bacterium]
MAIEPAYYLSFLNIEELDFCWHINWPCYLACVLSIGVTGNRDESTVR